MADDDLRTRRKAIEFTKKLCKDVPSLRPAVAVAPQCLSCLADNLRHTDELIQCSSVGLLRELVDDQKTLASLKADQKLTQSFTEALKHMRGLSGEDRDAVLEEIAMADEIADHLGIE